MLNPWLFISGLIIFTLTFLAKLLLFNSPKPGENSPPSPPTLPIFGNLHQIGLFPQRSLRRLSQRYGPVMKLKFGSRPVVVVSSAEAAGEVMKTQDILFSSRPRTNLSYKLLYQGRGISTAPYGEYWRQIRSICVLNLLSSKRVHSFRSIREEEAKNLVENIRELSTKPFPVNLSEMFASLTNDIVCRVAFGKKYGREEDERRYFRELLSEFMRLLGSFSVGDFIPSLWWVNKINGLDARVDRVVKAFDEFLDRVVDEHVEESDRKFRGEYKDLVAVLLEIQEDTKKPGFAFDRGNIKAIILDIFSGGTDTTYTVLEWAMAELLKHPTTLRKLQDEVTQISGGKPDLSESDSDKSPYLKAVIKETLRLYPPIPLLVPRESHQDTKIKGFDVAARTMVITNAWAIGRDPDLWDDPEEFKPERFLNSSVDFKGNDGFQLIPFGGGRRGCPGAFFAMAIVELALANLVYKFDWSLPVGTKEEDLDMKECFGLIIHRKAPLFAIATPRF